jgi:hypothetical protein
MSRKRTGRRNTRVLNARLDNELDGDLIAWLDAQPAGRRSEAIRDLMRDGLRARDLQVDLADSVRRAVSEALQGIQIVAAQRGVEFNTNDVEQAFGDKLDQMLGGFG